MTELIICTTCRPLHQPREQRASGELLLEVVQAEQAFGGRPDWAAVQVRGVACLAGCSHACTAAFQAAGKYSYQFGDLNPQAETARQLLDCAVLHQQVADGSLAHEVRPPLLRNGMLCRLPPILASVGDPVVGAP